MLGAAMQRQGVELDDQANKILNVLRGEQDKWHNRRDIAKKLGKNQLNPYDIAVLQMLGMQGQVETDQRENNSPVGWEWVYRAKETG
jgi:hypothetical protein